MKITNHQLRKIIQEFWEKEAKTQASRPADIDFKWSPDGLEMQMMVSGKKVVGFMRQKEVEELIGRLEELLSGPMRTSP